MVIRASSLRRYTGPDPDSWTDGLLQQLSGLTVGARGGSAGARSMLENQLLVSQMVTYQNPFVSCSFSRAIAIGFALDGDTGGYVLTISGDRSSGLDFEALRTEFNLFRDNVDYLKEFGIPRELGAAFTLDRVERVDFHPLKETQVYP